MQVISSTQAHLIHVGTLSGPGTRPGIRPVIRGDRQESRSWCPDVPWPFGLPAFASWIILSRPGIEPSSRSADQTTTSVRTLTGFPRSTRMRHDRVGCPLDPGTVVLARPTPNPRSAPATSQRPVLHPCRAFHPKGLNVTGHHRGFTGVHPSGLPLACGPWMAQGPLGFSPELRTPPLPATHVQVGTGLEHWPGTTLPTTPSAGPPSCESTHYTRPRVALRPRCW
jgi:hypothetical protein